MWLPPKGLRCKYLPTTKANEEVKRFREFLSSLLAVIGDPLVEAVSGETSAVRGKNGETAIRMDARLTLSGVTNFS
jgi:hypothetical protein